MIRYKCNKCDAVLESSDEIGGGYDTCPLCGHKCPVPLSNAQRREKQRREKAQRESQRAVTEERKADAPQSLRQTPRIRHEPDGATPLDDEELATLRVVRPGLTGLLVKFNIFIDERRVARLACAKSVSISIVPGHHVLRVLANTSYASKTGGAGALGAFCGATEEFSVGSGEQITWEIGNTWFGTVSLTRSMDQGFGVDHVVDEPRSRSTNSLSRALAGAAIGAIIGGIVGPHVAAEFTRVYVFQAPEYRILGAIIGAALGALIAQSAK